MCVSFGGGVKQINLVHLLEHLSNFTGAISSLLASLAVAEPARLRRAVATAPVTPNHILQPNQVNDLIAQYRAGTSMAELSRNFKVHRETVRTQLDRAGVQRRPVQPVLSEEQVTESVVLYGQGWSTYRVGAKFGVSQNTVARTLHKRGIALRPNTIGRTT
jgi:lambda repressor-like predicted transcriptional regulator